MPELVEKDMLFTMKGVDEIVSIISGLDKSKLEYHAKVNFARASDFEQTKLKDKRNQFFKTFLAKHFEQ